MDINDVKNIIHGFSDDSVVVEIDGPTFPRSAFLRDNQIILPGKTIVTNKVSPIIINICDQKRKVIIDKIVDIRKIPFKRDSIDIITNSYLTLYKNDNQPKKRRHIRRSVAFLHYKMGFVSSKINLHISLFRESYKVLRIGGLLIIEGLMEQDLGIANKVGFEMLHLNRSKQNGLTGVFIKPIKVATNKLK